MNFTLTALQPIVPAELLLGDGEVERCRRAAETGRGPRQVVSAQAQLPGGAAAEIDELTRLGEAEALAETADDEP